MYKKLCGLGLVILLAMTVTACVPPTPTAPPQYLVKDTTIYNNPNNPFIQPIPAGCGLQDNSVSYINHMDSVITRQSWFNHDWSVPIFFADTSNAPNRTHIWYGESNLVFYGQRIPTCTTGQIAGEGHVTVVNQVEGCMQHYWGYNVGAWPNYPHAFYACAQPKDFDATWQAQGGMPARAGNNAGGLVGGYVWPDELTSVIPRGQQFVLPKNHNKGGVVPANQPGDGTGTCAWDLPQGARLQLNPTYDVTSWYTFERVYAQALKTYGMFLMDSNVPNSGILAYSAMPSRASSVSNPFAGCFPDCKPNETATDILMNYDLTQFRVLPFGAPVTTSPVANYSTFCGWYNQDPIPLSAPTLSSISPSTAAAGTTVTLTGTNLTGSYHVIFGTVDAWNPTVVSSTQVRCVVPAGSGTVAVKVRTGGGTSGTVSFIYGGGGTPPTLSSINPTSGTTAGGTACTLTGTNLTGCSAVSFGGTAASGIVVDSSTQVRCTSPAKSAGTISVTATTANGTSGGVNYTFIAPPPTLSAINPNSGSTAGGTACTLTGTNLTGCSAVSFGGTAASGIVVDSSTQVRCTSPAKSAGTISVTATTPNGTSGGVNYTYTPGGGPSYTATLYAAADCAVYKTSSNTNFNGQRCNLQTNATVDAYFYAKFSLSSVQGTSITKATFRWNTWAGVSGYTIKAYSCSTDSWAETTIKWNGKPAIGTQQASTTITTGSAYFDWDVTSYISSEFAGDKTATIVMRDDLSQGKNCQFYDKEAGASVQPQLVVISQS